MSPIEPPLGYVVAVGSEMSLLPGGTPIFPLKGPLPSPKDPPGSGPNDRRSASSCSQRNLRSVLVGVGLPPKGKMRVPLSDELRDVPIEFQCPACSHPIVRMGSWLKTIAAFRCDGCGDKVRIGYEEKLAIFERYLRKTGGTNGRNQGKVATSPGEECSSGGIHRFRVSI